MKKHAACLYQALIMLLTVCNVTRHRTTQRKHCYIQRQGLCVYVVLFTRTNCCVCCIGVKSQNQKYGSIFICLDTNCSVIQYIQKGRCCCGLQLSSSKHSSSPNITEPPSNYPLLDTPPKSEITEDGVMMTGILEVNA